MNPLVIRFVLPAVGVVGALIVLTPMHVRPDFTTDKSITQPSPATVLPDEGRLVQPDE